MNRILRFLPFVVVFICSLYQPSDADLGWHLKYGEYFFKTGHILFNNTLSTQMSNYQWANSSWATDLITYSTYHFFGFLGLSILSALVMSLTFFLFSRIAELDFFEEALIFPIIILFVEPVTNISFRGQLLSILLTGVLFFLIYFYEKGQKKILFLTIPLFALWTNIHGQFILGLVLFYFWGFLYLISKLPNKADFISNLKNLIPIFILTGVATLITPWGLRLYTDDILLHLNSPDLKYISEYLPFTEQSSSWWNQVISGFLILFGLMSLFFNDDIKKKYPLISPGILLYGLSFWVRRYSWAMYFLIFPILKPVTAFFKPEKLKNQTISATVILLIFLGLYIWLASPFQRISNMNWDTYCQIYLECSSNSIKYLETNNVRQPMMTLYDWGGWMIWNYPDVKPSIDGRMHLWKDQNGYSAFDEYFPIEQNNIDVDQSKYNSVLMNKNKLVYHHLIKLVEEKKWIIKYEDQTAVVFERVSNEVGK